MARHAAVDEAAWRSRGRIRKGKDGPVYVIRKQVDSRRYEIALGARTLEQALGEYALFERDPVAYEKQARAVAAPPPPSREPVYLDTALADAFLKWSRDVKGNTPRWVHEQKLYLDAWQRKLAGVDLRRATFKDHIRPALEGVRSYRPRVAVILGLYRWLRLERDLELSEDPVHGRFFLPDPAPEQWKKVKAVPREHFDKALEHLTGIYRHVLVLQGGTGCHVTEAWRFMTGGSIEPLPVGALKDGSAGVVVFPLTKGKDVLRVRVDKRTLEAAEKVLAFGAKSAEHEKRKAFSKERYVDAVKSACEVAKVPIFKPGQMRHSIATAAVNAGADLEAVSAFLGHKNPKTTRRFYATHGAVRKVPTLNDAPAAQTAKPEAQ
jgi:integrase